MKKILSILVSICCIVTTNCVKKDSSLNHIVEADKEGNFYYIKDGYQLMDLEIQCI